MLSLRQTVGLEIQRKLRKNAAHMHPLRSLFWECTLRCNMHCRHCGSDCLADARVPDMPAQDFLRAIDTLLPHVDPHDTFIIISGGEPLLREDLCEVGQALYERGFPWGVVSNGYLLSRSLLERLFLSGMHSMSISLDGTAAEHNRLRGHPSSFEHALRAVDLLSEREDILWDVVSCITPRTLPLLSEMKEMLLAHGVRSWRIFTVAPMGRAADDASLQLSPSELHSLMQFISQTRQTDPRLSLSFACEGFLGQYEGRVRDHLFHCRSGIEVASIRADGTISGCTSVRSDFAQGNIYQDDLWQTWQNGFSSMRDRSWTRKEQCASCRAWRFCEGGGLHLYDANRHLSSCLYQRMQS